MGETAEREASPRPNRWVRGRRLALVALTAFAGSVFFRSSYFALRDRGPAVWALALMLALLAAACWTLTFSLIRSRRATRAPAPDEPSNVQRPDAGATTPDATP
jgi:drug/metabolite transporter (DMT)-like permease